MKKLLPLAIPAIIVAGWFGYMSQENKPKVIDFELNTRICANTAYSTALNYASKNEYDISVEARDYMMNEIKSQCAKSIRYKVAKQEFNVLYTEGDFYAKGVKMFNDGLDYEESKTARYGIGIAKVNADAMGDKNPSQAKAWANAYAEKFN